ncbi:MAG: dTMP kinase [Ilumatobacteraceae bacterium]|nr:dTMP kinase [Actinomycetota bacterium]MDA3011228.1 dTMP kinase [Actinomycetota bacterium]MDA3024352.1 dTMP kinase [Actinomycetota bacterium]
MTTTAHYIAFEGIEGCGKSTQASRLAADIGAVLTRETGGTQIGARIRDVLHDPANTHLSPVAETLLIAGDRAQHYAEVLEPNLSAGRHVVSDRSVYSSIAYQGYGRALDLEQVQSVNRWAIHDRWPDLVVLLDIDHTTAMARIGDRSLDRFEREEAGFFQRIVEGFRTMAREDPNRWIVLDGDQQPDVIADRVRSIVRERFGI